MQIFIGVDVKYFKWTVIFLILFAVTWKSVGYYTSRPARKICKLFLKGSSFSAEQFLDVSSEEEVFLAEVSNLESDLESISEAERSGPRVVLISNGRSKSFAIDLVREIDKKSLSGNATATTLVRPGFGKLTCEINFSQGKVKSRSLRGWD